MTVRSNRLRRGIRHLQASNKVCAIFDNPTLISSAGLVPVMRLAERAGLHELLESHVSVASPNAALKFSRVITGMLAGTDSIDDLDLLRHGSMAKVFAGVRAPSTSGTFLRAFTFGHVRQVDATRTLTGLAAAVPRLPAGAEAMAFIDSDDTIRQAHAYHKQDVSYGYSGVNGISLPVSRDSGAGRCGA